jgi:hypothetical protein
MATAFKLDSGAVEYLNWLGYSISECEMPGSLRVRVAASCLAIAQDHHHAIVALLDHGLFASSFALLRCEFEAYVRGEWLALCATDEEVEAFSEGEEPPPMGRMLNSLEATPAFSEKVLSGIKASSWRAMCAYTHTGGLHVQRWGTGSVIEPNYEAEEVQEALSFAEVFGALAVVGIASLANNEKIAETVLAKVKERSGNES